MNITAQRKSPRSLAAVGACVEQRSGACKDSLCASDFTTGHPSNQVCATCGFFKIVRLSVRSRSFCMLTGQKLPASTPGCEFWPGVDSAEGVLP